MLDLDTIFSGIFGLLLCCIAASLVAAGFTWGTPMLALKFMVLVSYLTFRIGTE